MEHLILLPQLLLLLSKLLLFLPPLLRFPPPLPGLVHLLLGISGPCLPLFLLILRPLLTKSDLQYTLGPRYYLYLLLRPLPLLLLLLHPPGLGPARPHVVSLAQRLPSPPSSLPTPPATIIVDSDITVGH